MALRIGRLRRASGWRWPLMDREEMRRAREQLRQQQQDQRHARIEGRLNEEAAINKAAKDDAEASDKEAADFIRDLNGMSPRQIKRGAKRLRGDMSGRQRRAIRTALKRKDN